MLNLYGAKSIVVAIPETFEAGQIVQQARAASPAIRIIARAHSDAEVDYLTAHGADAVIMGEREIAQGDRRNSFEPLSMPPGSPVTACASGSSSRAEEGADIRAIASVTRRS